MSTKSRRIVNGYALLYRPDHFNCLTGVNWEGYVYEHRWVMECHLDRSLAPEEIVHHLDCNKLNNDLSNLILISRSDHMKIHDWIDKGAVVYESHDENGENSGNATSEVKLCQICERCLNRIQKVTCSKNCHNQLMAKSMRKVKDRPSYETLIEDLKTLPVTGVGRKYGVSDNAIRKWLKKYETDMSILSRAESTLSEGAETSGEVKPS